ncbi:hypothetical protein MBLNU457_2323t1 [Dothideomycetes sp. NU457]
MEDNTPSTTPVSSRSNSVTGVREQLAVAPNLTFEQLSFTSPTVRHNERHALHFFIHFTAPQIAGPFGSVFWQQMVLQAAYRDRPILHALIGLGSLHEGIVQSTSQADLERNPRYTFALRHVNNAIKSMRVDPNDKESKQPSMRLILTLCILLTTFEAFQGRSTDVLKHTMQGIKLFDSSKNSLEAAGSRSDSQLSPVSIGALQSVFSYYATFCSTITGQLAPMLMNARVYLPPRFSSLSEAQNLFFDAKNAITMSLWLAVRHPSLETRTQSERELKFYACWIEEWRKAFEAFLAREHTHFNADDTKQALILRANYLYAYITSHVDCHGMMPSNASERYAVLQPKIHEMLEICEEIARMEEAPQMPTQVTAKNSYFSYGMWITESLYVASVYSPNEETRQRAGAIFMTNARPEALIHCGPYLRGDLLDRARDKAEEPLLYEEESPSDSSAPATSSNVSSSYGPSPVGQEGNT